MIRNSSALKPDSSRLDNIKWVQIIQRESLSLKQLFVRFSRNIDLWYIKSLFSLSTSHQVMGSGGHCSAVPAGADVGLWPSLHQWEHSYHGLPLHHLQRLPGHVHLHLPLCSAEEGNDTRLVFEGLLYIMDVVMNKQMKCCGDEWMDVRVWLIFSIHVQSDCIKYILLLPWVKSLCCSTLGPGYWN